MDDSAATEATPIETAIEVLGSQSALANAVGRTQQAVSDVVRKRRAVPAEWVLPIETATAGRVTRHQLRPDLYPTPSEAA